MNPDITLQATNDLAGVAINPNKALWEKGDFTRIADTMRKSGESLVAALGITKGMNILDLGCGAGVPVAKKLAERA